MNLLLLGASVRAAAHSALRAGLGPIGIDLFADRDLAAVAPVVRVEPSRGGYPAGLFEQAECWLPGPWLYTGAIENHPDLVDRLARQRPLWGNPGATLEAVRDPFRVVQALRRANLPATAVRPDPTGLPRDGNWLIKPRASAGGRRIVPLHRDTQSLDEPYHIQQRIVGVPLAAIFLGSGSGAALLGITRQRLGRPGAPFAYAGSLGPWPLPAEPTRLLRRIGDCLATTFALKGLLGLDFVLRDGIPWPVEVNPRYTASVEVLERASGTALLADHARVFDPDVLPEPAERARWVPPRKSFVGKAILFASKPCAVPEALPPWSGPVDLDGTAIADIPWPGTRFEPGDPVLTVFARGASAEDCGRRLDRTLNRWRGLLLRCKARPRTNPATSA